MAPLLLFTLAALLVTGAAAYTNHTVGGPAGWFFDHNTNTPSANYTSWAANQTFVLGDYLIFNTNENQTVVLTYDENTFRTCIMDNSTEFGVLNGKPGEMLTLEVPLIIEGQNYFFSASDDGIQCENGMAFGIYVSHGVGLPPSLNQPPPPPYVAPPSNNYGSLTRPSGGFRAVLYYALTFYGILALFHG